MNDKRNYLLLLRKEIANIYSITLSFLGGDLRNIELKKTLEITGKPTLDRKPGWNVNLIYRL